MFSYLMNHIFVAPFPPFACLFLLHLQFFIKYFVSLFLFSFREKEAREGREESTSLESLIKELMI